MSSSQLTFTPSVFRGVGRLKPPTRICFEGSMFLPFRHNLGSFWPRNQWKTAALFGWSDGSFTWQQLEAVPRDDFDWNIARNNSLPTLVFTHFYTLYIPLIMSRFLCDDVSIRFLFCGCDVLNVLFCICRLMISVLFWPIGVSKLVPVLNNIWTHKLDCGELPSGNLT